MRRLKLLLVALCMWLGFAALPTMAQGAFDTRNIPNAELDQDCTGGDAGACDILGERYLTGDGAAKDPKKAAAYFQRACDRGDAPGCYNIAESYRYGDGVSKNPAKAAALYQRACDGRERKGCAELSLLFGMGEGVKKSDAQAALYADRACALDSLLGCAILGAVFAEGVEGYPQDVKRGEALLRDACFTNVDFAKAPDLTGQFACASLARLTGNPACKVVEKAGGGATQYCFEARDSTAIWTATAVQSAAPIVAPARARLAQATVAAPASPALASISCAKNLDTAQLSREKVNKLELLCERYFESKIYFKDIAVVWKNYPSSYEIIMRRERHLEQFIEDSRSVEEFLKWYKEQGDFHTELIAKIEAKP